MEVYELGTDLNSNWDFKDGDLQVISGKDNLTQAIRNRLNTEKGTLDSFYNVYGSIVYSFAGELTNQTMLDFLKIEIDATLKQDPRLEDASVDLEYIGDGEVHISVENVYSDDSDLSNSFVLDANGEVLSDGD